MSRFTDAVARMTIDTEFIRFTRRQPERTASIYALTAAEAALLRELADAAINDRTAALRVLVATEAGTTSGHYEDTTIVGMSAGVPADLPTLLTIA